MATVSFNTVNLLNLYKTEFIDIIIIIMVNNKQLRNKLIDVL